MIETSLIKTPLRGKVIKILDKYRVIVDIGFGQPIKNDMKFIIYEYGEEVRDPTTNEVIDKIELIKHRIRVEHIQEKFSIMKSDEYYHPVFDRLFGVTGSATIEPFKTKDESTDSSVSVKKEFDKSIKVGDLVRQDIT